MKTKMFRMISRSLLMLIAMILFGSPQAYPSAEMANTETEPSAQDCFSSVDPETGQQPNPDCPSTQGSIITEIAQVHKLDSSCPLPTVKQGSECVLQGDAVLETTLAVDSFTHLNCKGHRLAPSILGIPGNVAVRSQPEVAILLREAYGVKIQNCIIDGFDFGIFALKSKVSSDVRSDSGALALLRNKILANTINARFVPVSLVSVDNTEIKDNTISFYTNGGVGLSVQRDSDINQIKNNVITADLIATGAVRVPGPSGASNPVFNSGAAVFITQIEGTEPILFNAIIEGTLYQLTATNNPVPDGDFTEDNLFEGNSVVLLNNPSQFPSDGVVLAISQRTIVNGNSIEQANASVKAGAQTGLRQFRGTCTLESSRFCLTSSDCNIPGFDIVSMGACILPPSQLVNWVTDGTVIENNLLLYPILGGIGVAGANTLIQGNYIVGPLGAPGAPNGGGIALFGKSLETTTITRNTISGVSPVLRFNRVLPGNAASFFGAKVFLNDFINYNRPAVLTSNDYDLGSELSVDGRGNYWGFPQCPGFDPGSVLFLNGTVNPLVADRNPYVVPIANTPDALLPATCP